GSKSQTAKLPDPGASGGRRAVPGGRGGAEPASIALWRCSGRTRRHSAGAPESQRKNQRTLGARSRRSTECGAQSRHHSAPGYVYPDLHSLPESRGLPGVLEATEARAAAKAWEATWRAVILPPTVYARHHRQGFRENHLRSPYDFHREPGWPLGPPIWLSAGAIHGQCHPDRHLHCQEGARGKPLAWRTIEYCAVVTLDVRNAFNSARWNNILTALSRIHTPRYLMRIINSYFRERVLSYSTDDGPESCRVTAGVPQGSVLGPTLWNVMYDAILQLEFRHGVQIVGFADEIALIRVAKHLWQLENQLDATVSQVREALGDLSLKTADHKTEVLLITKRRQMESITIKVGDCYVSSSPHIRYLGLHIDARLNFKAHLKMASERASNVAGALARIMPTIGGPRSSRRKLYASVVDSILLYGAPIWSCATETQAYFRQAESVHRRACLRVISGRPHVSYEATYVLAGIPPPRDQTSACGSTYAAQRTPKKKNVSRH
ncbi:unnamed protein product, partial [Trichogramma brassicae]